MNGGRAFLKRVGYAISANFLSLFVSVLTALIVPKFLGDNIEQYGYFQIYIFYTTYIGFFHFGWCDGIYLRDGGKEYTTLDKSLYSGQFWLLTIVQCTIASIVCIFGFLFAENRDYLFVCSAIAVGIIVYIPRTMLAYYLQTTNRIKEYASITGVGRMVYGLSLVSIFIFCSQNYKFFVVGDLFGKFIGLLVAIWWCRDIVFSRPTALLKTISEANKNIRVGINLMFANIAGMLISGIVRFGIQMQWDVATYGKISLTLSVSNLMMTFIGAVALVLYPTMRRSNENKLIELYGTLRSILMVPVLGLLILYYPMFLVLSRWLPQYAESMRYMAILVPLCIYSAKMSMLITTYMKVFRLEKVILRVNIAGVAVSVCTTAISVFLFKSLTLAMVSIVINQIFRSTYAEVMLSKHTNIKVIKNCVQELLLTALFILSNWFVGGVTGVASYIVGYSVYLMFNRDSIMALLSQVKQLRK